MTPMRNCILVRMPRDTEQKIGGIVFTSSAMGSDPVPVVAVGPGVVEPRVGNLVLLPKHGGESFRDGRARYKVIKADEVLAIVEG